MPDLKRPKGPQTIYDVASRARVSIASVSRVLNGLGTPRAATRDRVMRAVTLAGTPGRGLMNVRCDNDAGMRALVRHLVADHGYRSIAYLSGRTDSPDNRARQKALEAEAAANGAEAWTGVEWRGNYSAAGGAKVITALLDDGRKLPRAIVCANDQTALGAMHALARRGIGVPQAVPITAFHDGPVP